MPQSPPAARVARSRTVRLYVAAIATCAVAATASALALSGPPPRLDWVVALVVISIVVSVGPPQVIGRVQIFTSGIAVIAAIPLIGPVGALLVSVAPVVLARNEAIKRVYNAAMRALFTLAGAAAYHASGGRTLDGTPMRESEIFVLAGQMALASVALATTNVLLLAGILRVTVGTPIRSSLVGMRATTVPGYIGYAVAAFLLVVLWAPSGLSWFAALLALPTMTFAGWATRQYVAEWETRQHILAALLAALDVRHPGSSVEAQEVAAVAEQLGLTLGLPPREVETLSDAARLHDVGLLALPASVLAPDHPVAVPAVDLLRAHPGAAREMLGDITFLGGALEIIETHHERMDGTGYPHGLVGDAIPYGARVLAVAEAYVSLVSPRAGRPALAPAAAALACEQLVGHLDQSVVAALPAVVDRLGGQVADRLEEGRGQRLPAAIGSVADHAHPEWAASPEQA